MEKLKAIIKEHIADADCGIYFTPNGAGDTMEVIYCDEKYLVLICYGLSYFEIFGLNETEQEEITRYYNSICD